MAYYDTPKRKAKPISLIILALFIFLSVSVSLIFWLKPSFIFPNQVVSMKKLTKLPVKYNESVLPFQDGLLSMQQSSLNFVKSNGQTPWTTRLSFPDGRIAASDKIIAVYKDQQVEVISSKGKALFTKSFPAEVYGVKCSAQYIAVSTVNENAVPVLLLFDIKGNLVDQILFSSQTLLNFGFYNEGLDLWTIGLDSNGTLPISRISTYTPGKSMTGAITITDQIVYDVLYMKKQIIAVGTNSMICYNYIGQPVSNVGIYGWYLQRKSGITLEGANMILSPVHSKEEDSMKSVTSTKIVSSAQKEFILPLPENSKGFITKEKGFIAIGQSSLWIYDFEGKNEKRIRFPFEVKNALVSKSGKGLFIIQDDTIYFYNYS